MNAAVALVLNATFDAPESSEMAEPDVKPEVLFELYYNQSRASASNAITETYCALPSSSLDLAFDDSVLDNVEGAWRHVNKIDDDETKEAPYMVFKSREHYDDDDE